MSLIHNFLAPFNFADLDLSQVSAGPTKHDPAIWGLLDDVQMPEQKISFYDWVQGQPRELLETIDSGQFLTPLNPPSGLSWLVDRLIPEGGIGLLYGPSASGKSLIAASLAVHLSTQETHWNGLELQNVQQMHNPYAGDFIQKVFPSPVVYLAYEDHQGVKCRVLGQLNHMGHPGIDQRILTVASCSITLDHPNFVEQLAIQIKAAKEKPSLVVIDTLTLMLGNMDENSASTASILVQKLTALKAQLGNATFLILHHSNKSDSNEFRGTGGFKANMDFVLQCKPEKTGTRKKVTLSEVKQKNGPADRSFTFKIETVPVSPFTELSHQTTAIVVPVSDSGSGSSSGTQKPSGSRSGANEGADVTASVDPSKGSIKTQPEIFMETLHNIVALAPCGTKKIASGESAFAHFQSAMVAKGVKSGSIRARIAEFKNDHPKLAALGIKFDSTTGNFEWPIEGSDKAHEAS